MQQHLFVCLLYKKKNCRVFFCVWIIIQCKQKLTGKGRLQTDLFLLRKGDTLMLISTASIEHGMKGGCKLEDIIRQNHSPISIRCYRALREREYLVLFSGVVCKICGNKSRPEVLFYWQTTQRNKRMKGKFQISLLTSQYCINVVKFTASVQSYHAFIFQLKLIRFSSDTD